MSFQEQNQMTWGEQQCQSWTDWHNRDKPTWSADGELVKDNPAVCPNPTGVQVNIWSYSQLVGLSLSILTISDHQGPITRHRLKIRNSWYRQNYNKTICHTSSSYSWFWHESDTFIGKLSFNRYSATRAFYAQTPISLTLLIHCYSCSGTVAVKSLMVSWKSQFKFYQGADSWEDRFFNRWSCHHRWKRLQL